MITVVPPGGEVWNGKERIMVQKNKKGHLLAKAALVVSIAKDVAIVLIEIVKLLRK